MILKFVYNGEIHRCSKHPDNIPALLEAIAASFKDTLPEKFKLKYEDPDGDKIILLNDEDYKAMLEMGVPGGPTSVKIFIEASEDGFSSQVHPKMQVEDSSVEKDSRNKPLLDNIEQAESIIIQKPQIIADQDKKLEPEGSKSNDFEIKRVSSEIIEELPNEEPKEDVSKPQEVQSKPEEKVQEEVPLKKEEPLKEEPVKDSQPQQLPIHESKPLPKKKEPEFITGGRPDDEEDNSSKELTFDAVLKRAENMSASYPLDPQLKRTIENTALNTIKANLPIISAAVKDSIVETKPEVSSVSKEIVTDTISYLSYLIPNIEGITSKSVEQINETLRLLTAQVEGISSQKKAPEQWKPFIPQEEEKVQQPVPKPMKKPGYGVALVREINQLPAELTTNDFVVYKTICLKNTGTIAWPENATLQSLGQINGQPVKIGSLEPGEEKTTVLVIDTPRRGGKFLSPWRVVSVAPNGETKNVGDPFELVLNIKEVENQSKFKIPGIFFL